MKRQADKNPKQKVKKQTPHVSICAGYDMDESNMFTGPLNVSIPNGALAKNHSVSPIPT